MRAGAVEPTRTTTYGALIKVFALAHTHTPYARCFFPIRPFFYRVGRQQAGGSKRSAGESDGGGGGGGGGNCGGPGVCVPLRAGGQQHTARKQETKRRTSSEKWGGGVAVFAIASCGESGRQTQAQTHARSKRSMLCGA